MSATLATSSTARVKVSSSGIPLTQNTAPVFEHRALYTHDLRRKAKRWQDGFVKFHTFNNRILLYDEGRNHVGEGFHQAGRDGLQDGDEITLERTAVLLEVGERISTQQTDLTELFAKRTPKPIDNDVSRSQSRLGSKSQGPGSLQAQSFNLPPRTQGQWRGWGDKSQLLHQSPFEQRHEATAIAAENKPDQEPPAKRRRRDDAHVSLFELIRTTKPGAVSTSTTAPTTPDLTRVVGKHVDKAVQRGAPGSKTVSNGQARLKVKEVIDITSSAEDHSEPEATRGGIFNSSPTKAPVVPPLLPTNKTNQPLMKAAAGTTRPLPRIVHRSQQHKPNNQTTAGLDTGSKIPEQKIQHAPQTTDEQNAATSDNCQRSAKAPSKPTRNAATTKNIIANTPARMPPSSPPVSTTNHISAATTPGLVDNTVTTANLPQPPELNRRMQRPVQPQGQTLRLTTTAPRTMLMCQTLPGTKAKPPPKPLQHRRSRSPVQITTVGGTNESTAPTLQQPSRSLISKATLPAKDEIPSSPAFETQKPLGERRAREKATQRGAEETGTSETAPAEQETLHADLRTRPAADYGALDAQLLIGQDHDVRRPIAVPKALHRSLRRTMSDTTSLQPLPVHTRKPVAATTNIDITSENQPPVRDSSTISSIPPPQKARTRPFRRAETHVGVPERTNGNSKNINRPINIDPRGHVIPAAVTVRPSEATEDAKGPWTSEAWDLMGWIPQMKVTGVKERAKDKEAVDEATSWPPIDESKAVQAAHQQKWMEALLSRQGVLVKGV